MKTKNKLPMSQDPAHNWQASDGGKRALGKQAGFNSPHFPHLSFDGCGINGRDEYRTRLCTFTEKRGEDANRYGPLFAAAPELLEALRQYQAAFDALFSHCLSNGVFSQQGKPFDCTAVNDANSSACAAIAKATLKL